MNQMTRFGIILGVICLLATMVLAVTYQVTKPKIDAQLKAEEQTALKGIMPDATSFAEKKATDIEYFEALRGGQVIGYCIKAIGSGYNGYIRLIVGIDLSGTIRGVRVLEHQETPGLGARITEIKPGEKDAHFLRQFIGKNGRTVALRKDIDAIAGATISSKAVTDAVNKAVSDFLDRKR